MSETFIRHALTALTAIGVFGAAFELAAEQHWQTTEQMIPWGAIVLLGMAVLLLLGNDSPRLVAAARLLALVVLLASVFGVYAHVAANYDAGPLDQRYSATWDILPVVTRWWYALTKVVGPAPPLAPGMLGQSALLLLLATRIRRKPAEDATRGQGS
ncbi:hypothetical protein ACFLIM_19505 [Nonomuraea sp. M3C6]|uniref:Uncharacterized protein n=1 Tax=Nonomuraea marmarensis TaxID=3351344 RepID=A0ABW7ADG0_9ACTN